MHSFKLFLIIGCSFASGWFTLSAIITAAERINDWREAARWAVAGAVCVAGVLIVFP